MTVTPVDLTDAACMAHDRCYARSGFTAGSNFQGFNAALQACNQQLCDAVRARLNYLLRTLPPAEVLSGTSPETNAAGDINLYFTWIIAPWGNACH